MSSSHCLAARRHGLGSPAPNSQKISRGLGSCHWAHRRIDDDLSYVEAFRSGLTDNALIEGRNITVDTVWVMNEPEYDQAVIELVRRGARVLVPAGSSATAAAKRQTSTIPIVFISVGDPVGIGIVESLSHPGRNATGFTDVLADLSGKLVEFARELVTQGAPVGYLWHDKWPDGHNRLVATVQAAQAAGIILRPWAISEIVELDGIVSDMRSNGTTIIIVQPSPFTMASKSDHRVSHQSRPRNDMRLASWAARGCTDRVWS